jgi:hypothetical protein
VGDEIKLLNKKEVDHQNKLFKIDILSYDGFIEK